MFPHFQPIKYTSVSFTINKILQGCVGKAEGLKRSNMVETSFYHISTDDMVLNPTHDVLSEITCGGWYLEG